MSPQLLAVLLLACGAPSSAPQTSALVPAAPAGVPQPPHSHGAVVYVPVYSSIYIAEGNQTFDLTVTVTVRNTDRQQAITVIDADFFDTAGRLVHAYVTEPTQLAPLASADIVVRESDTRAGVGGSFVVEWRSSGEVTEPLVQAVMIGSGHQQGISFVSEGHVLQRESSSLAEPSPPGTPTPRRD